MTPLFITSLAALLLTNLVFAQPSAQPSIYINAGGPKYVDSNNNTWIADQYFNTGNPYSVTNSIANTFDETLYRSERWSASPLQYAIPVLNGSYNVTLHFAEVWAGSSGSRIFNVTVERDVVVAKLDIYDESERMRPWLFEFPQQ